MYNAQIAKDRIKLMCKEKGISSEKMLEQLSLGVNAIRQINDIKGMASFSLAKIADYLDCSVDYLLGRTDKPKPEAEVVKQNDNHGLNMGINAVEFAVPVTVAQETRLDENQQELLTRFGQLQYKDKLAFMQELVEKTEGNE